MITMKQLEECHKMAVVVEDLEERVIRLKELMEKTTPAYGVDVVQTSVAKDRVTERIAKLEELESLYFERRDQYIEDVLEVEKAIALLPEQKYRDIMQFRYVDGMKWEEVAEKAAYSRSQCIRIHELALSYLIVVDVLSNDGTKWYADMG